MLGLDGDSKALQTYGASEFFIPSLRSATLRRPSIIEVKSPPPFRGLHGCPPEQALALGSRHCQALRACEVVSHRAYQQGLSYSEF